ncbi:MAG: pilus assembly protein, partial [Planctomycetales bacterium]|nr:pilus assembly protein [Planctomycetales bacterium]
MNHDRNHRRRGLATLELVLWIPVLLMVTALMVVYGTSVAWRIRGEVAARDAVWRVLTPRTGRSEPRPPEPMWPEASNGATYGFEDDAPLSVIDDPAIQHPVIRGPIGNGWQVTSILDPDAEGMLRGTSSIVR